MSSEYNNRPWHKKSHIWLLALIGVLILAGIGSADMSKTKSSTKEQAASSSNAKQYRFAERADKQNVDVEVLTNEPATINGVKMTVTGVNYSPSLGQFDNADPGKTYLVADVKLENTGKKTTPYNTFDFRVQTSGGQVLDNAFAVLSNPLHSGDLVSGGTVSGQVVFEPPIEDGHQYIIWKPGISSDRAIVRVK